MQLETHEVLKKAAAVWRADNNIPTHLVTPDEQRAVVLP